MSRIQLRVHGDLGVLGDEVAGAVLRILSSALNSRTQGREIALAFRKEFGGKLQDLLVSRELCGTLTWCSEELEPIDTGDERLKVDGMRVFTLSDPAVLQEIVLSLSTLAYRTIARLMDKKESEDITYTVVVHAVEAEMLRHAFNSGRCGMHPFCQEALAT